MEVKMDNTKLPRLSSSQQRWLNFLREAHNFIFNFIL